MINSCEDLIFVLLCISAVLFIIQLIYLICVYNLHSNKDNVYRENQATPALSVIIVAKDSIEELKKNLPLVLAQDYPDFEVIVVYEQYDKIMEQELILLQREYSNLYHTFIPDSARYISHKKLGLTIGIKAAKNDILVFTEPNAYPVSNQWLNRIASNFTNNTDFVLGYSNFESKKGWFNKKIVFDRLLDSMRTLGLANDGLPYTASGYNLAYRKSFFYKKGGFNKYLYLKRGEDDLFVNEFAKSNNTKVELSSDSIIRIDQPINNMDWAQEKLSGYITKRYYKGVGKYISGFETTTRLLFFLIIYSTIAISIINMNWISLGVASSLIIIRFIVQICMFHSTCSALKERKYIFTLPFFDIYQPLLNFNFIVKKKLTNKKDFLRK